MFLTYFYREGRGRHKTELELTAQDLKDQLSEVFNDLFVPLRKWKEYADSKPTHSSQVSELSAENSEFESLSWLGDTNNLGTKKKRKSGKAKARVKGTKKGKHDSSSTSSQGRRRHDMFISALFRNIKDVINVMVVTFSNQANHKSRDITKNIMCSFEVFNRVFLPMFGLNGANLVRAFTDFVALKHVPKKAEKIFEYLSE